MAQLKQKWQCNTVDDKFVINNEIVVHRFLISDVEDPMLYAAKPLYEWEQSEAGQWVLQHAVEKPRWQYQVDHHNYGTEFIIVARLTEQDQTYWSLKFK